MRRILLDLILPLIIGASLYASLWYGTGPLYESALNSITPEDGVVKISFPWYMIAVDLVPGFAVGLYCTKRPILIGFIAIFIGAVVMFYFTWHPAPKPDDLPMWWQAFYGGLQKAFYGAAGGALGFLIKRRALTTQSR